MPLKIYREPALHFTQNSTMERAGEDDGFYVTLPSNTGLNVFKNNTISSYRVNLPRHINLEGPWQVALTEISYPHTWHNVPEESAYFEWMDKEEKKIVRQRLTAGYYKNVNHLIGEIEYLLREIKSDIYFHPDMLVNKLFFEAGGKYQLCFHAPIAFILGVNPGEWITFDKLSSPHPMDMNAGLYLFYCYSDVVEQQVVGDVYAPLLRTIKIDGKFGDVIMQTFNPPHYIPVARSHIENIAIELRSDQNIPINFTYGKVVVKLHFRPAAILQRTVR